MKTVIIYGAYGLVGTNLIEIARQFIHEPYKIVKIKCDESPEEMADIIIYAAGYGQPLKFCEDKIATIEINTVSLINAFSFLKPNGKFLYVSSSEVYSGATPPYKEDIMGTTTPEHSRACYIEGKRCGEAICMAFREKGFDVKIARLSLAYGAAKLGDGRVLNQIIEQGLTGHIILRDSGTAMRTYCYITDACELMWKILLNGRDVVYNVGGFSTVSIRELAEEIASQMNATLTIPTENNNLQGAPESVCLDMGKTLNEFQQFFIPLSHGLKLTIDKYKNV